MTIHAKKSSEANPEVILPQCALIVAFIFVMCSNNALLYLFYWFGIIVEYYPNIANYKRTVMKYRTWQWRKVHTLEHNHTFSAVPGLKKYFNVGPFPVPGNVETINNLMFEWEADGTYEVVAGPSTRRIIDFADVRRNSWSILPTGQSGNVMSPHYKDQAEMHAKGEFRRMLMDREEIEAVARNKTVFRVSDGN